MITHVLLKEKKDLITKQTLKKIVMTLKKEKKKKHLITTELMKISTFNLI